MRIKPRIEPDYNPYDRTADWWSQSTQNKAEWEQNFGHNLDYLIVSSNLSTRSLAKAIGVSPTSVSLWRNGQRKPTFRLALKLAQYFQIPVDDLLAPCEEKVRNGVLGQKKQIKFETYLER